MAPGEDTEDIDAKSYRNLVNHIEKVIQIKPHSKNRLQQRPHVRWKAPPRPVEYDSPSDSNPNNTPNQH